MSSDNLVIEERWGTRKMSRGASAAFSIETGGEERLVVIAEVERSAILGLDVKDVCDSIRANIALETELSAYAIQLIRTASIYKTSSGKIQRKACKEAYLAKKLDLLGESLMEDISQSDKEGSDRVI